MKMQHNISSWMKYIIMQLSEKIMHSACAYFIPTCKYDINLLSCLKYLEKLSVLNVS